MRRYVSILANATALVALGLVGLAGPSFGAGFGIFEQGSKAMGMAGAFTAQADDPSAMFHNAAGLAFQEERDFLVGFTWISSLEGDFQGANPFPGAGATGELESLSEFPPHFYWVEPLGERTTFGLGLETPFGLVTDWKNPDSFPGRFISTRAALEVIDLNPTIAFEVSDRFSIGIGAIGRFAKVELTQHVPFPNPFTQTISDVATAELESDRDTGFGYNLGILHRASDFFSWGLSYRSTVDVDFSGEAIFFQNPTGTPLDQLIATQIPFNTDIGVETNIEFPDMASLGLAFHFTEDFVVETDVNWTGWSTFDMLPVDFAVDQFDTVSEQDWEDAWNYRLGVRWNTRAGNQWRLGYVFDETPQPEEAAGPLLPDEDRNGFTVGYGFVGRKYTFDLAVMYLDFEEREVTRSFENFLGTYQTEGLLVGVTLGF